VTLVYRYDTFTPHLFTYRDFQDQNCIDLFLSARVMLKKILDKR
jgi:hypothetical protein